MECQQIQRVVWTDGPDATAEQHARTCPTCASEVRKAGDLRAALHGLQTRLAVAPVGLESAILETAHRKPVERVRHIVSNPRFVRGAAIGAAAAAAAATAAIGVMAARRRGLLAEPAA